MPAWVHSCARRLQRYILKRDAEIINIACEGLGTDDDLLIKVVCQRTKDQLQQVKQNYFDKYNKSLAVCCPQVKARFSIDSPDLDRMS